MFTVNNSNALKVLAVVSIFTLALLPTIKGKASTTSPFWDAGTSGSGYQNIKFTDGFVGIGVTNPSAKLDVGGSSEPVHFSNPNNSGQYIYFNFDGSNVGHIGSYKAGTGYYNVELGNGGNVGIGNSSPVSKLDVNGDIATSSAITIPDNLRAPGSVMVKVGDDAFLTDVDQANTLGVYGAANTAEGRIKLGSGGGSVKGFSNGDMCIGNC